MEDDPVAALALERAGRMFAEDVIARLSLELVRVTRSGTMKPADLGRVEELLSESWRRLGGLERF